MFSHWTNFSIYFFLGSTKTSEGMCVQKRLCSRKDLATWPWDSWWTFCTYFFICKMAIRTGIHLTTWIYRSVSTWKQSGTNCILTAFSMLLLFRWCVVVPGKPMSWTKSRLVTVKFRWKCWGLGLLVGLSVDRWTDASSSRIKREYKIPIPGKGLNKRSFKPVYLVLVMWPELFFLRWAPGDPASTCPPWIYSFIYLCNPLSIKNSESSLGCLGE